MLESEKMKYQKLISVIIPVYDVAEYIPRCLDSIINNSYTDLEIICINDGSIDDSLNVLKHYAEKDDRICVIDKNNGGVASARNAGLQMAKGEYIAFVDPDDWVHKDYFLFLIKGITDANADLAICDYVQTSNCHALDGERNYSMRRMTVEEMSSNHSTKTYIWKRLYKRSVLKNIAFNEKVAIEDSVFNLDVLVTNTDLKIVYVDAILYAYYFREGSLVSTFDNAAFIESAELFYEYSRRESRNSVASIIAEDGIKKALAARYISILLQDNKNVKRTNQVIDNCIPLLTNGKFKYVLFKYIPELYRIFRLINDKTMIKYEAQIKAKRELQVEDK